LKNIIFTFDYELFFRESGTSLNCMIVPTNRLINCFEKFNIKGTFFVDTVFLQRLITENETTLYDFQQIESQLIRLVKLGHRIELHLHPHWLDAKYNSTKNQWFFPTYKHYMLSSLPEEKIIELFSTGINLLEGIARKVDKEYKVVAFRAGGWCIEPFIILKRAFEKNGLIIDSSVANGIFGESETHSFDFRDTPELNYYWFSDTTHKKNSNGSFLEIPISTYYRTYFDKFLNKFKKPKSDLSTNLLGDGKGLNPRKKTLKNTWANRLKFYEKAMFSIDGVVDVEFLLRKIGKSKSSTIVFIGHPKMLTESSFNFLENMGRLQSINFITLQRYYSEFIKAND
jgi:hypothetical protein